MNNNKLVVLAAFIVVCGEEWEGKAEVGHRYVQHAISACYGTLFEYLLHMVWFHGYN